MPLTLAELSALVWVDPADIQALVASYPDDVTDLWSEAGVLSEIAVEDLELTLNPCDARIQLGRLFRMQDRYICPECGRRLRWIESDPATDAWQECSFDGSRWRPIGDGVLRPADQVRPNSIVHFPGAKVRP